MKTPKIKAGLAAAVACASLLTLHSSPASAQNNDEFTTGQVSAIMDQCAARSGSEVFGGRGIFGLGEWRDCVLGDGTEVICDIGPGRSLWTCIVFRDEVNR